MVVPFSCSFCYISFHSFEALKKQQKTTKNNKKQRPLVHYHHSRTGKSRYSTAPAPSAAAATAAATSTGSGGNGNSGGIGGGIGSSRTPVSHTRTSQLASRLAHSQHPSATAWMVGDGNGGNAFKEVSRVIVVLLCDVCKCACGCGAVRADEIR